MSIARKAVRSVPYRACRACGYVAVVALVAAIVTCGPRRAPREQPVLRLWGDSLSWTQVRELAPDTALPDSLLALRAARMAALCGDASPLADSARARLVRELSEQLALRTNTAWNPRAAALALGAVRALINLAEGRQSAQSMIAAIDSISRASGAWLPAAPIPAVTDTSVFTQREWWKDRDLCARAASRVLLLPQESAALLADFALTENAAPGSGNATSLVKGLVWSASSGPASSPGAPSKPAVTSAQALAALKLRPQNSIHDSIVKHSVDLKEIYKKSLKANVSLAGEVWVTFRVTPAGSVADVKIWKSQINDPTFTTPFLAYLRDLRFQPIAEGAGDMSFNYPFEFTPE